jgi:hypothetical protein
VLPAAGLAAAPAWADSGVALFSPSSTVKAVRQVRAQFATPMVPFGDMGLPAPFAIDCGKAEPAVVAGARTLGRRAQLEL